MKIKKQTMKPQPPTKAKTRLYWLIILTAASLCALALALAAIVAVREGWHTATEDPIECSVVFRPLPYTINGYIEFFLEKQEPSEPVFEGSYFINLTQEYGRSPMRLRVTTSGARNY